MQAIAVLILLKTKFNPSEVDLNSFLFSEVSTSTNKKKYKSSKNAVSFSKIN